MTLFFALFCWDLLVGSSSLTMNNLPRSNKASMNLTNIYFESNLSQVRICRLPGIELYNSSQPSD